MYSIKQYDWTLHMAAIALCAYFLAKAVTTHVGGVLEALPEAAPLKAQKPVMPPAESEETDEEMNLERYEAIVTRNIFNSAESGVMKEEGEAISPEQIGELGPAVKTSLGIKVFSTLVVGEGTDRRSSAIVSGGEAKGKKTEVYFVGDEQSFAPNVKLTKVDKSRIEFVNGGRLEFAELEDFASKKSIFGSPEEVHFKEGEKGEKGEPTAASESATKVTLDQREIDEALQNMDKLYSEIRIVPNFKGGRPAGMKVLSIKPGSVVSKLGIRRGDILEKLNGQELDVQRGMELFSSMREMKNFSLDVVRGGKNQTLEYEIR